MYALGLTIKLFGESERATRGLSVLCLLVGNVLAFDLARRVVLSRGGGPVRALVAGVLAVAVYALNPLAIQAAMILDIDNTVLMVLLTALTWLAIRLPGLLGSPDHRRHRAALRRGDLGEDDDAADLRGGAGVHPAVPAGRLARRAPGDCRRRAGLGDLRA